MTVRIATFNLENLDDGINVQPPLVDRIQIMRPQLVRVAADIVCLQEINSQGSAGSRTLAALDQLLILFRSQVETNYPGPSCYAVQSQFVPT